MTDLVERLRTAFDGEDVVQKNLALRAAHDEITRLRAELAAVRKAVLEEAARVAEIEASSLSPREMGNDSVWGPIYRTRIAYAIRALAERTP